MAWSRPQIAAVSVIPVLAVAWMVVRAVRIESPPPPDTRHAATGMAPYQPAAPQPRPTPQLSISLETETDANGRFQLRGLAPGGYRVTFGELSDSTYTTLDGVHLNAIYGANLLNLRLHSADATATLRSDEYQPNRLPHVIRGNIVDAGGAPLPGVRLRAQRR